ncbi:MAG: hypothetical protein ABS75_16505 [Pelagibacterium sp. SCN 63-23]|nr:MAG: hypothetical protein ABS75_16505 [Pelagibacterium sp. SCN 63-23]
MILNDAQVLERLGVPGAQMLGAGNEASVYVLGPDRVIRIMKPGASLEQARVRAGLLGEIAVAAASLPFRTPQVELVAELEGRIFAVEKRLGGSTVAECLGTLHGEARARLVESYLETASSIGAIPIDRAKFGPLFGDVGLLAATWNGFLKARLALSATTCPQELREAVRAVAEIELTEPERGALVHLDYFPGNVLAEKGTISAVLDFGASSIIGDARMEAWSAVAYLDAEISPMARDSDRLQAMDWLGRNGLLAEYGRAKNWLAAYWSFAIDDAALMAWCRRVLLGQAGGSSLPRGR